MVDIDKLQAEYDAVSAIDRRACIAVHAAKVSVERAEKNYQDAIASRAFVCEQRLAARRALVTAIRAQR